MAERESLTRNVAHAMLPHMELDLSKMSQGARYKILTALVIPRPIAWVTTYNQDGSVNAAPYSFFNVMGNRPPLVAFGPGYRQDGSPKDTPSNIQRNGVFVVNLVDRELAELMHQSAAPYPPGVSETEALGIETEAASTLEAPRIRRAKVHLECRHWNTLEIEDNRVVFGLVEHMHVADGLIDPETHHVTPGAFDAVGRLQGPGWYATARDQFDLGRMPSVK